MTQISIIIPVYNVKESLASCLASVANQSFRDFEALLIDDGSTDGSHEICAQMARQDPRFRVLSQKNAGVSSARNRGLRVARSPFVTFVDADDTLEERALSTLTALLTMSDSDAVVCDAYFRGNVIRYLPEVVRNSSALNSEDILVEHLNLRFVSGIWVFMFRRKSIDGLLFNEEIHQMEDWEFILRFLSRQVKIQVCHEALYRNVLREGSASQTPLNQRIMSALELPAIAQSILGRRSGAPKITRALTVLRVRLVLKLLGMAARAGTQSAAHLAELRGYARQCLRVGLLNRRLNAKEKGYLILGSLTPKGFIQIYRVIHGEVQKTAPLTPSYRS